MRRIVPVVTATAGTLALLANFHTSPGGSGVAAGALHRTTTTGGAPTASTTTSASPATGPSPTVATRTVDGPVTSTRYGDVQVRVTLRGRQLVDVQPLTLPSDRSRSVAISSYAEPRLRAEALRAQSAQIDLVSGASYTSDGYAQSLQGALDQAGQ